MDFTEQGISDAKHNLMIAVFCLLFHTIQLGIGSRMKCNFVIGYANNY